MSMELDYKIIAVELLGGYRLRLTYDNGGTAETDLSAAIATGPVFMPLADPEKFAQVFIGERGRSLEWPNDVGLCADALWFEAHPEDYAKFLESIGAVTAPQ
jgi:hypothetical protein